ncbi:MAG: hypothetical protein IIC50_23160 [Planctomycetes bacterium]|nr:hypothetical protein [Planctomycetota bacterium]
MICPDCHQRILSFGKFLLTLNPFKIACSHCHTNLKARPIVYVWIGLHGVLGLVLAPIWIKLDAFDGPAAKLGFVFAAVCLVFVTAYLIPFFMIRRAYEKAE